MPSSFSIVLNFQQELNTSLQIGDDVYYNSLNPMGGFLSNGAMSTIHVGEVTDISYAPSYTTITSEVVEGEIIVTEVFTEQVWSVVVLSYHVDNYGNPCVNGIGGCMATATPTAGAYISFSKSSVVNNNDLTGYYASVDFVNNSKDKAELFSAATNVTESSK